MQLVGEKEMQSVMAGAKYTATCSYCGKKFITTYWPLLISKATAKVMCEGKLHNHILEVHYDL